MSFVTSIKVHLWELRSSTMLKFVFIIFIHLLQQSTSSCIILSLMIGLILEKKNKLMINLNGFDWIKL